LVISAEGRRSRTLGFSQRYPVDGCCVVPFPIVPGITPQSIKSADKKLATAAVYPGLPAAAGSLGRLSTMDFNIAVPPVGGSDPNIFPDHWATRDCQVCMKTCWNNPYSWATLNVWLCELGCWTPFIGGCNETPCSVGAGCNSDQTCCGSQCCSPGDVCGNSQLGYCCPADHPVFCGDETGGLCYPSHWSCCHPHDAFACPPGFACTNYTCCPNRQACGEKCCTGNQTCVYGVCVDGLPCGNTFCGFGSACCNGSCCPFGTTCCDASGSCCPGQCLNGVCVSPPPIGPRPSKCLATWTECGDQCCPPEKSCCKPFGVLGCYEPYQCHGPIG